MEFNVRFVYKFEIIHLHGKINHLDPKLDIENLFLFVVSRVAEALLFSNASASASTMKKITASASASTASASDKK